MATQQLPNKDAMKASVKQLVIKDSVCKTLLAAVETPARQLESFMDWMSTVDIEALSTSHANSTAKSEDLEEKVDRYNNFFLHQEIAEAHPYVPKDSTRFHELLSNTSEFAFQLLVRNDGLPLEWMRHDPVMSSMLDQAIARRGTPSDTARTAELERQLDEAQNVISDLRETNRSLKDSNAQMKADLTDVYRREFDLKQSLQDTNDMLQHANDSIERYKDEITSLKKDNGYAESLLRCVSDYPEQGSHWEGLRHAMKWPSRIQFVPCQGPVWMEDWNTCARPQLPRSFTQALCDACVCLYQASLTRTALDVESRRLHTRDCLRHLVNCLMTVPEVHHGLYITFVIAAKSFLAYAEASPFDITLLLCQIAHLAAVRCPSDPRRQTAAEIRASASRHLTWSNRHLLDAVLEGWQGDARTAIAIEFCCPTVSGDGHAVYVHSVDAVLFISNGLRLCWLSRSCINFMESDFGQIRMENTATHEVIEFIIDGPKHEELWELLAR